MTEPARKQPAAARLIAVVDDDYRVLESLDDLLQASGYRTLLHTSAEALLESTAFGSVDALISDIGLPGMNGIELLRIVRQSLALPLPAILITGRSEPHLEQHARALGVLRFFTKPFDTKELLDALDHQFPS